MAPTHISAAVTTNSRTTALPSSCCNARARILSWVDQNIIFIASTIYRHAPTFHPMMARVTACCANALGSHNTVAIPTAILISKCGLERSNRTNTGLVPGVGVGTWSIVGYRILRPSLLRLNGSEQKRIYGIHPPKCSQSHTGKSRLRRRYRICSPGSYLGRPDDSSNDADRLLDWAEDGYPTLLTPRSFLDQMPNDRSGGAITQATLTGAIASRYFQPRCASATASAMITLARDRMWAAAIDLTLPKPRTFSGSIASSIAAA